MKRKLKKLVKLYGPAKVAVLIGLRDTTQVKQWIYSDRQIPEKYHLIIKNLKEIM